MSKSFQKQEMDGQIRHTPRRQQNPFTWDEERALQNGVRLYGFDWRHILKTFEFAEGRTASDLKDKWRNMSKRY